jgi:tetratricopeptide (TPR) repeat protein
MPNTPSTEKTAPQAGAGANKTIPIPLAMSIAAQKIDAGDLKPAEIMLRQILQRQPENAHAMHLLGIIAHKVGRTELALELIGKAIDKLPNEPQFHINRGEMCRTLKRLDEAIAHGEKAIKLSPASASAHSNLGIAYYDRKDYERAEACQKQALELDPQLVPALNNMGSIMRGLKDRPAAIAWYEKVLAINPNYLESINNLGALLIEEDRADEAIQTLLRALKLNPKYADAHNNIGNAFMVKEQYDKAAAAYHTALKLKPDYPEALLGLARVHKEKEKLDDALIFAKRGMEANPEKPEAFSLLGDIYLKLGQYQESGDAYAQALKLDSESLSAHLGLGQLRMEEGQIDEAQQLFEKAMEINSEQVAPYVFMAQAKKIKAGDPLIDRLEAEARELATMPETKAMSLHFALGKVYDDVKEYDKAFPHFLEGCRIKRSRLQYSADNHDKMCREIQRYFSPEAIGRLRGAGDPSDLPIFVLGMPRSGTTLVETILASHPDVFAAGELHDILRIANNPKVGVKSEGFPISMQGLTRDDLTKMGERYVAGLRKHSAAARKITDKMPANFLALGLIHLMLPNAKIVHLKRNAADICLSSFTKNFNNSQFHSYDLTEMGRFYVDYARLMEHWRKVLPEDSFYEVQYEELVADPENQSRRLVEFCGLSWDDACLTPHKTERTVKTASVTQVREPVYTSSVERWRRYEKHLQPLFDALGEYAPAR